MKADTKATALISRYGFIDAQGADAGAFLQSQLAADMAALDEEQTVLTGWHDPKGRVLCCMRVVRKESGYWLAMPRTMVTDTLTGLSRFVLRSKVTLSDASERLGAAAVLRSIDGGETERFEIFAPIDELGARVAQHHEQGVHKLDENEWELGDIRAGLPQVYPQTRSLYTGQMLNLDLIGGISFTKGCFPGQEIIARTHYLGRPKRRMLRYVSAAAPREPGESLLGPDGRRAGQVVRSAATDAGSESLVVTAVDHPEVLGAEDGATLDPNTLPYSLI